MSSLIDCPECACLFRASDASCPFCGHTQRHTFSPSWTAVALSASLGVMGAACQIDKNLGDTAATDPSESGTEAAADSETAGDTSTSNGPLTTTSGGENTVGDSTVDPPNPSGDGATYAGPDEEWTTEDWGTTTTTTGGPSTTTTTTNWSTTDASTYAGPDEGWTTTGTGGPESTSTSTGTSGETTSTGTTGG